MPGIEFLIGLEWRDWVTIASLAFGLLTLAAYIDQRRAERTNRPVFDWMAKNYAKTIKEEEIEQLSERIADLETKLESEIPALARTAVLHEQVAIRERAIADHYVAWDQLTSELKQEDGPVADLDPIPLCQDS